MSEAASVRIAATAEKPAVLAIPASSLAMWEPRTRACCAASACCCADRSPATTSLTAGIVAESHQRLW